MQLDWESNASSPSYSGIGIVSEMWILCFCLNQATVCLDQMTLIWKLEVNMNYVVHKPQASPFILAHFCNRKKEFLSKEPLKRGGELVRAGALQAASGTHSGGYSRSTRR